MHLNWTVEPSDLKAVRRLLAEKRNHALVLDRHKRNLLPVKPQVSRTRFWRALVASILTTQQRAGPQSAVTRFLCARPFLLSYERCRTCGPVDKYVTMTLSAFGGVRRHTTIGLELAKNMTRLEQAGKWHEVLGKVNCLRAADSRPLEADVADYLDDTFVGIGPKQARNLLQTLGLTRYEIPLDSRIMRWLNEHRTFPIRLTGTGLADRAYYGFVLDAVNELCCRAGISMCIRCGSVCLL